METKNKILAAISYLWILCIVTIICGKNDPFARYHANQGLVLLIASFAMAIVCAVLGFVLGLIPVIGGTIAMAIGAIADIVFIVLTVLGIVNAVKGEMKPLPFIGGIQILK